MKTNVCVILGRFSVFVFTTSGVYKTKKKALPTDDTDTVRSWQTDRQTDSSVVSSLQQYIKTWHQLASACWWNKHPPSHSLVGELPHAVKLFLHCLSPFSSSSWVSMYVWKKKNLSAPHFVHPERKKKKKSCALRRSHCDRKQLELNRTHYSSAVRPVTLTKDKRERKKTNKKNKQNKTTKSDETVSNEPPDPHRLE